VGHDLIDSTEMYLRVVLELEEEGVPALRARVAERLLTGEFHSGQLIVADVSADGTTVDFRAIDAPVAPDTPPVELAGSGGSGGDADALPAPEAD